MGKRDHRMRDELQVVCDHPLLLTTCRLFALKDFKTFYFILVNLLY